MIRVSPIDEHNLGEVGVFLNQHLANRFSPDAWVASLTQRWAASQPNFGTQLRDGERLVGVFCAIYSDQWVDGRLERFCNPHSWCVLEPYRSSGLGLIVHLLRQRDYHFTMFTPNPKVAQVFTGLRFRVLDAAQWVMFNPPSVRRLVGRGTATGEAIAIAGLLEGRALQVFEAHRRLPWLNFVAFGAGADMCLAIYKRDRWRRMGCAWLMYLSDPAALARHGGLLRHHLLMRCGLPVSRIEGRFIGAPPAGAVRVERTQPKLVLSATLRDSQVLDAYSELMALDL